MEKELLGQYIDMQEERRDLERRIRRMGAKLAVHTEAAAQAEKEMEEAKERLDSLLLELERDIQKVENSRIRRILRYRFGDGLSWMEVAACMGGRNTADSCRMALKNYLDKIG